MLFDIWSSTDDVQVDANRDPDAFPDPDSVRLDRPMESYIHYGVGPHTCLGKEASKVALTAMLRVVGGLDNLRRAPGPQGELKKIPRPNNFYSYMLEDETSFYAFPMSESWQIIYLAIYVLTWNLQHLKYILMVPFSADEVLS